MRATLIAALAVGFASTASWCLRLQSRVRELESALSASRAAVAEAKPVEKPIEKPAEEPEDQQVEKPAVVTNAPPQMAVVNVEYDDETKLDVLLSERPDMEVVRSYVSVEPMAEGRPVFNYRAKYNQSKGRYEPHLRISGEFACRTNVTLRI